MPGLTQRPSMMQNLKTRNTRSPSPRNFGNNVSALGTKRQGNPAILKFFGKTFKDAFTEAKQIEGKRALECVEKPSPEKFNEENHVTGQNVLPVTIQANQATIQKDDHAQGENASDCSSSGPVIAGGDTGVPHNGIVAGQFGDLNTASHRELIDTITILTRKVDEFSNAMHKGASTTRDVESQSESPVARSSGQSPTSSTSLHSSATPVTSIGSGEGTIIPAPAMEKGKGRATVRDEASDRINFLKSEVATYEQVVACKENEILDMQEDHQAVVEDLKEELAAAEARLNASEADLKKEQASKKKTMTQRNEFANLNRQLKAQIGTAGDSPLVRAQRAAIEQLHAEVRKKDEELATAAARLKEEHCDGGFWHGAFILTMAELENANPDAAMRYNGIVRRKDEMISELEEERDKAKEEAREAYAAREDDRIKQSGILTAYRQWAAEFQGSIRVQSEVYGRLQDLINNVGRTCFSKMPRDDVTEALIQACERINIENDKLALAANTFDGQIIAKCEANAASEAKIAELEAALELDWHKQQLVRSDSRAMQVALDEKDTSHSIVVDDLTDRVQELEKALDKQTKAKDSLERQAHAIAGTVAGTVISGLNDQIYGLKVEIANLKADAQGWRTAFAHEHGALMEARGVGKDGQDLDIGVSGPHFHDIQDYQVETLRRRLKIAEAPVLAGLGKFRDRIEKKGGILAAWGIQYEVEEVDTE